MGPPTQKASHLKESLVGLLFRRLSLGLLYNDPLLGFLYKESIERVLHRGSHRQESLWGLVYEGISFGSPIYGSAIGTPL